MGDLGGELVQVAAGAGEALAEVVGGHLQHLGHRITLACAIRPLAAAPSAPKGPQRLDFPGKDGGPYLMDHSSIVYLLDRNGRFVTHFTHEAKAEAIAAAVGAALSLSAERLAQPEQVPVHVAGALVGLVSVYVRVVVPPQPTITAVNSDTAVNFEESDIISFSYNGFNLPDQDFRPRVRRFRCDVFLGYF